jgi:CHASE2 domain-containing sensor protein
MIVGGPVLLGGAAGTLAVLLSPIMAVLAAISAHRSGKKGVLALAVALLTITGFCAIVALAVIFPTVVSTSVLESATGL